MNSIAAHPSSPSLRSWLFALASLAIVITLSLCLVIGAALWEHEWALGKLDQALATNDRGPIDRVLILFERGASRVDSLHDLLTLSRDSNSGAEFRHFLYEVGLRRDLLNSKEVSDSLADYNNLDLGQLSQDTQLLAKSLQIKLEELGQIHQSNHTRRNALATLANRRKKLVEQHTLVATDMSQFFSLPSMYESKDEQKLLTYRSGTLQDLPMLQKIPDRIDGLVALREALRGAGGKVKLETDNPAYEFSSRLNLLRQSSLPIITEYRRVESEENSSQAEITSSEKKAQTIAKQVRTLIRDSMPAVVR